MRISGGTIFWGVIILAMVGAVVAEPASIPYRLAGALNGAIFGAIAGGIGALLQYVIQRKVTAKPLTIFVFLGFLVGQATEQSINFVGGQFYDQTVKPRVTQEVFARQLDTMPIYQAVKRADPDAYDRLRSEVSKRVANGASGQDIENYTRTYMANFRQTNAEAALSASPEALAASVRTLSDILDHLHSRDQNLCAEYVLKAFTSERIRSLTREKDFAMLIEKQATTNIDAIADGLRAKRTYQPLSEADIQLAVHGLDQLGWSDEMRAALVDPTKLGSIPPEQVCRIQREWFATLAELPEPARTRWYREVLGPLLRS